ncbi:MAG: GAF domain-containing protein, partial [Anaerolineales bacterium]
MDSLTLGIFLLLIGAVLTLLTWLVLRGLTRTRQARPAARPSLGISTRRDPHTDAVVTIEAGGRVLDCNNLARQWFELGNREPTLETLARQVRPSQNFLSLCAGEGQARFTLRGRHTEANSYPVPSRDYGQVMMVVMRQPTGASLMSADLTQSGRAIQIFTELSQKMASSLELSPTLNAVLESVEQLIPADFSEINIWDQEQQILISYRFVGMAGVDRHMEQTTEQYLPGEGYSGYLIAERQSLLITNVDDPKNLVYPNLDRQKYPFRSYLGVPLVAGKELVGTLELASFDQGRFTQSDLETINLLAGPAAVALHNADLFEQKQLQARELTGLSRLVQATTAITNSESLISRLVDSLHVLFDVERLGFLLYDESRQMLVCQSPFIGIPSEVVDMYRVSVPEASPADHILKSQDMIIAPQAPNHSALATLGLNQVAEAAGMRDTILVPLNATGKFLGYLQVANKANGQPFDEDDIRLLTIVAGQVGPLLGNAALLQESRGRVQRSEALRRIASLAGSAATLDEILAFSLQELQHMLGADMAGIYLLDEQAGELCLHLPSLSGITGEQVQSAMRLPVDAPDFSSTVTSSQRSFLSRHAAEDEHILPFFKSLVTELNLVSLIDVPLVIRDRGAGELILASRELESFNQSDLVFAATAAGQLAGAVERSVLYSQTDEKLRRRVEELTALTMVSRELNSAQNPETLLRRVLDEAKRSTRADGGRAVLLDPAAADQEQPILLLGDTFSAPVHVLEQRVMETGQLLTLDYTIQADELPLVGGTHSVLIVPVTVAGRTLGVLHLWSQAAGSFDSLAQELVQALCVQASAGLSSMLHDQEQSRQNALLERRVETFTRLMETARSQHAAQSLPDAMQAVARAIRDVTPFQAVLISSYDPAGETLQRIAGAGFSPDQLQELQHFTQPWRSIQEYLQEQYRYGHTYFIPAEKKPVDPPDIHMVYVMQPRAADQNRQMWNPDDLLLLPLHDSSGSPLGLISVDDPVDGQRPDRATLDTLELIASQAAVILENQIMLSSLETQLYETQQEIVRTEKSAEVSRSNLPLLLQKDREQLERLYSLNQRVEQIRAGLETAELVHQAQDRTTALHQFGSELLLRFGWDVALVADVDEGGPRLVHMLGAVVDDGGLNALLGQRNPLRQCIQTGDLVLEADVAQT